MVAGSTRVVFMAASLLLTPHLATADNVEPNEPGAMFSNPIAEGADPWVIRHNGYYYWCLSWNQHVIEVWKSDTLTDLGTRHVAWTPPEEGPHSREIWAPELHRLDGKWYIYVAASDGHNINHRTIVLESLADEPLGPFEFKGELYTGDNPDLKSANRWSIDATPLEVNGKRYVVWSGWPADRDVQFLYIAQLVNPWTVAGPRVRLCNNSDYVWERTYEDPTQRGLHEAPQVLQRNGRTFVIYSCSGSWESNYKLGLLELRTGGDPLNPNDWKKHPEPVFKRSATTSGVGHCSFVSSSDGREHWFLYHAKAEREDGWRRAMFAQPFRFDDAGFPQFGAPDAWGAIRTTPFGERPAARQRIRDQFQGRLVGWAYDGTGQYPTKRNGRLHLGHRYLGVEETPPIERFLSRRFQAADLRAHAQVSMVSGSGSAGFVLRANHGSQQTLSGYYVGISPTQQQIFIKAISDGHETMLAETQHPIKHGESYALHVVMRGERITVALHGAVVLKASDSRFTAGTVGLQVIDGHAWFDQFEARGEE